MILVVCATLNDFGCVCDLKWFWLCVRPWMILVVGSTWERFLSCVRPENGWVVCWRPQKEWFWPWVRFEKDLVLFPTLKIGSVHDPWKIFIRVFDPAKTFCPLFAIRSYQESGRVYVRPRKEFGCMSHLFLLYFLYEPFSLPAGPAVTRREIYTTPYWTRVRMGSWSGRADVFSFSLFCFVVVVYVCEVGLPLSGYHI